MSSGWDTPAKAAATPLFLAFDASVAGKTGGFYDNSAHKTCPWTKTAGDNEKLYAYCQKLIADAAAKSKAAGKSESKGEL